MQSDKPAVDVRFRGSSSPNGVVSLGVVIFICQIFVGGPWIGYQGVLMATVGILMIAYPPVICPPLHWRLLAAFALILSCMGFLPVSWVGMPPWRIALENTGLDTGSAIVVQQRQAVENLAIIAITMAAWFWAIGFRLSVNLVKHLSLAFVVTVAIYALFARLMQPLPEKPGESPHFGFFPNRNHTATYLAMGFTCGIGCLFQAIRDKRLAITIISVAALSVCSLAIYAWSLSRGGILLAALGALLFVMCVGIRYLGTNGRRTMALLVIAVIGGLLTLQTKAKTRIIESFNKANSVLNMESKDEAPQDLGSFVAERIISAESIDFRIPIMQDALSLIRDYPWTGVGAGQFSAVFPQYRNRSCVANDTDCLHPESDWIWAACELGIPTALLMLVLVLLAIVHSVKLVRHGTNRAARAGCLAAACILPIHGIFDVPGHRLSLSLAAAVLYAASLDHESQWRHVRRKSRAAWRLMGGFSLFVGICFFSNWKFQTPELALSSARIARKDASDLAQLDQQLKDQAIREGRVYNPPPEADPLEKALGILNSSDRFAPLDRRNLRYRALIGLQFDNKMEEVLKLQERERILDPYWVALPFLQASALVATAPNHAQPLIHESLRRASLIEKIRPDHPWAPKSTLDHMRSRTHAQPDLIKILPPLTLPPLKEE